MSIDRQLETARVSNFGTGEIICEVKLPGAPRALATSPNEKVVLVATETALLSLDPTSLEIKSTHSEANVKAIAFTADGRNVFVTAGNAIMFYSVDSHASSTPGAADIMKLESLSAHAAEIRCVATSPFSQHAVTGSNDKTAILWTWPVTSSSHSTQLIKGATLTGHTDAVRAAVFVSDSVVATGSQDNSVRIWSIATGICMKTLTNHSSYIFSLALSPDGLMLASSSGDKTVQVYKTRDFSAFRVLKCDNWVQRIAFVTSSVIYAAVYKERPVAFDVANTSVLKTYAPQVEPNGIAVLHGAAPSKVAFSCLFACILQNLPLRLRDL